MQKIAALQSDSLEALSGLTVDAVYSAEDYWHLCVAFRCIDGQTVVFTSEDIQIAKYFEVFPLRVAVESAEARPWRQLPQAETIASSRALWRYEWLEPVEPHPDLVGNGPHFVHRVGPAPASTSSTEPVVVLVAVELSFASGGRMLVYSSDSAPLNVEFVGDSKGVSTRLTELIESAA